MTDLEEGHVPETIKQQVSSVIALLLQHGIDYEQVLTQSQPLQYEFLLPKSKYYRYYTHQLFQHGPNTRQRLSPQPTPQPLTLKIEGNLQMISVGAMCEIVKEEIRQGKHTYQPFDHQTYIQEITIDTHHPRLQDKVTSLIQKYAQLFSRKKTKDPKHINEKTDKPSSKINEVRREIGANSDGSLGVYGGKKYEGLGVRDVPV